MLSNTTTYFLFFVCLCVGAAIGGLLQRLLSRRERRSGPPPASGNQLAKEGDLEVLSVWRTSSNKLWLEIDGVRLEDRDALLAEQRQRLLNLVIDLRPWLEGARPPAAPTTPTPAPAPTAAPTPAPVQPAAPTPAASAPPTNEKAKGKADEAPKPAPVLKSIVEQIDEILQVKLNAGPYRDRKIALVEGPGGTVLVKDGLNKYEGIEAVPDPEVKALIRAAVAEWEKGPR